MFRRILPVLCTAALLYACSPPATLMPPPPPTPSETAIFTQASATPSREPTRLPSQTLLPPTSTPIPHLLVCSPLQGLALDQMPGLVSNSYHPPAPGSDDPHQGVDLADRLPNTQVAISGRVVQAALPGIVAAVIKDRYPYGNAVLIETALDAQPVDAWLPAEIPILAPTLAYNSPLSCPAAAPISSSDPTRRSLYVLYAHMLQPSSVNVGDPISCAQPIGQVGSTGNALNPHLHFETRVGPSGMRFTSLAHYDNSATNEEMSNYCLWRISEFFQLVDPLKILALPGK